MLEAAAIILVQLPELAAVESKIVAFAVAADFEIPLAEAAGQVDAGYSALPLPKDDPMCSAASSC